MKMKRIPETVINELITLLGKYFAKINEKAPKTNSIRMLLRGSIKRHIKSNIQQRINLLRNELRRTIPRIR